MQPLFVICLFNALPVYDRKSPVLDPGKPRDPYKKKVHPSTCKTIRPLPGPTGSGFVVGIVFPFPDRFESGSQESLVQLRGIFKENGFFVAKDIHGVHVHG